MTTQQRRSSKMRAVGSRLEVMHGTARHTSGGLTKADLKINDFGSIVSRRASAVAKKANRLGPYMSKRFKKGQSGRTHNKGGGAKKGKPGRTQKGGDFIDDLMKGRRDYNKMQSGGGTLGDVGTGLMGLGGVTAATGVGTVATPFLEAGGAILKGADWISDLF